MKAFDILDMIDRERKPRETGLTMVLDKGLGRNAADDLMEYADYIDVIKLGWGTPRFCQESTIKEKIACYKENDILVSNGGTLFEIAYSQGRVDDFLRYAQRICLNSIEVSDGSIDLEGEKAKIIRRGIEMGFEVFSEVGKKEETEDAKLTIDQRIDEAKSDLSAGASKVIIEAREGGRGIGIFDKEGNVREDMARELVEGIGLENIIFEAPMKSQQVYLILNFGSDVSLGNIKTDDVVPLETLRRGFRGDTFGKL